MRVNNHEADAGCYIEGSRGQYGPDRLPEILEEFGIEISQYNHDTRWWRSIADDPEAATDADIGSPEIAWEGYTEAADRCEQLLNNSTTGGYWEWIDGEFFLVQTEIEGIVYVPVHDGDTYDDAWQALVDFGPGGAVTNYDDIEKGVKAFQFRCTITYEQEDA